MSKVGWDKRRAVPPGDAGRFGGTALRLSHPTFRNRNQLLEVAQRLDVLHRVGNILLRLVFVHWDPLDLHRNRSAEVVFFQDFEDGGKIDHARANHGDTFQALARASGWRRTWPRVV